MKSDRNLIDKTGFLAELLQENLQLLRSLDGARNPEDSEKHAGEARSCAKLLLEMTTDLHLRYVARAVRMKKRGAR